MLGAYKVITWKSSFNRLNEEYGIAKKKKQALDGLFEKGRISQSTHDSFNTEIVAAIAEIEKQQQELAQRMQQKTQELHNQIKTLEILLANYEIQYVAGEIDDNTYQLEINLLGSGLDTAKRELGTVQDAVNQLCTPSTPELSIAAPAAPIIEVVPELTMAAPELVIEEPVAAPAIEEAPILEQPIAAAEIVEAPAEPAPIFEEASIEQPVEVVAEEPVVEAAAAQEIATPEPVAEAVEEAPAEKTPLDSFEVAAADIVQRDLTQIVEEIIPENPREALVAAQEDVIVETPQEACVETQQIPLHCAKENLHEAYSDSENNE